MRFLTRRPASGQAPPRRARRRWAAAAALAAAAGVVAVAVVAAQGAPEAAPTPDDARFQVVDDGALPATRPPLRAPREPLAAEEIGYALQLVTQSDPGATDVHGDPGPQLLYAELPSVAAAPASGGGPRRVILTSYDYSSDRAARHEVDLTAGRVSESRSERWLQPPPAADEADEAMELALATEVPLAFREQFEAGQGVPLLAAEQVSYTAGTWVFEGATEGGEQCGEHRCLRLLVQAPSGAYLESADFVVDLTARSVVPVR